MLTGGCVLNIQNVCNSICDDHSDKSDLVKDACNDERLLYTMKNTLKKRWPHKAMSCYFKGIYHKT